MDPETLWTDYDAGGAAAILRHLTPDVVWEEAVSPGSQTWHGHEGVIALNQRWLEEFEGFRFERRGPSVLLGDATAAFPVAALGRGRLSGIDVAWDMVMVCRYRGDLIEHTFFRPTLDEARERCAELGYL